MSNTLVTTVWRAYKQYNHAFVNGCGRETMWYWVMRVSLARYITFNANDVREVLDYLVKQGHMVEGRSASRYRTFTKVLDTKGE